MSIMIITFFLKEKYPQSLENTTGFMYRYEFKYKVTTMRCNANERVLRADRLTRGVMWT